MNTRDRWFFALSLVMGVMPFSIMALALHFLPAQVPLMNILGSEIETVSKNRNLIIGLFCLVPVSAVLLAGYLKSRGIIEKNFYSVTVGAIVISLAFLCFVLYQLIKQAKSSNILQEFDFVGVISVCLAYLLALLGVPVYGIKPNDVLGFRNSFTCSSEFIWDRVHQHCSYVLIIGFTIIGTIISFLRGYIPLVILLTSCILFLMYVLYYSARTAKRIERLPNDSEPK